MIHNKLRLAILIIALSYSGLKGQSYGQIEDRFTKSVLSTSDSIAFKQSATLKFDLLIHYSELYDKTDEKRTKKQIRSKVTKMFSTPNNLDSSFHKLDVEKLLLGLSSITDSLSDSIFMKPIWLVNPEYLGSLGTRNGLFKIHVLLQKSSKKFGNKDDDVWQVFFYDAKF